MSDPTTLARDARQCLAQGLAALQAPGVPEQLMSVAQPVAQAMGLLHQIESTQGAKAGECAPQALDTVRSALAGLQAHAESHPSVAEAIASVAGSLNLVHSLAQSVTSQGSAQAAEPHSMSNGEAHAATVALSPEEAQRATARARSLAEQQAAAQQQASAQQQAPAATAPGDGLQVEAALGAHSTTNFYKGLSGNDVVDSGGIFVATYQIPDIGTKLSMTVSMPGGYEFLAQAVVAWTREAPMSSPGGHQDAPPGFGARFTDISQEGRQLVYRYVRNREPLFHDDL